MAFVPGMRNKPDTSPSNLHLDETPIPELLIRLTTDVALLPKGYTVELPRFEALRLIRRGLACAIAVGDFRASADLTISEDDALIALAEQEAAA